jgi:energy-coupling factor transporter ATP-binding protein EcfA2
VVRDWEGCRWPLFDRIEITGLFGNRDEIINFEKGDFVNIMYGLNGSGKTTVLAIINALLTQDYVSLVRLPFEEIKVFASRLIHRDINTELCFTINITEENEIIKEIKHIKGAKTFIDTSQDGSFVGLDISFPESKYFEDVQKLTIRKYSNATVCYCEVPLAAGGSGLKTNTSSRMVNGGIVLEIEESLQRSIYSNDTKQKEIFNKLKDIDKEILQSYGELFNTVGGNHSSQVCLRTLSSFDLIDEDWEYIANHHDNFEINRISNSRYHFNRDETYQPIVEIKDKNGNEYDMNEFINYHLDEETYQRLLSSDRMFRYSAKFVHDPDFGTEANPLLPERDPDGINLLRIGESEAKLIDDFFLIETEEFPFVGSEPRYAMNPSNPLKSDVNVVFLPASRIVGDLINPTSQLIDFANSIQKRYTEAVSFLKQQSEMISLFINSDMFDEKSYYEYADYFEKDQFGKPKREFSMFGGGAIRPDHEIENTHTYLELACSSLVHFEDQIESCTPNLKKYLDTLNKTTDLIPKKKNVIHLLEHNINFENIYIAIADLTSFWIVTEVLGEHFEKSISLDVNGKIMLFDETGKQLPLQALSSGEKQLMMLYWKILSSMRRDVTENIVIIDEPELSLHISWQRDFVENLLDILVYQRKFGDEADGGYDVKIIIATHSPSILVNQFEFSYELGNSDGV